MTDLANTLAFWCEQDARIPSPIRELRFEPDRGWRFDLAWPEPKVAVEVHGGEWSGGRHVRPAGFSADAEKLTAAAVHGWRVLVFTGQDVTRWQTWCLDRIDAALTSTPIPFERRPDEMSNAPRKRPGRVAVTSMARGKGRHATAGRLRKGRPGNDE